EGGGGLSAGARVQAGHFLGPPKRRPLRRGLHHPHALLRSGAQSTSPEAPGVVVGAGVVGGWSGAMRCGDAGVVEDAGA
ncbi:hypothetical protein, partial [Chondromyces apiculatus]|uniref:hypothetical protein n=1 Tax=Chondromyces apiculatus TaxID=51 RepID=UPI001E59A126